MLIRKQFKFEGAHIVRKCSSLRCRKSIHGHSYIVEVFIKSNTLDNGQMVYDFGLLGAVKEFIDSFDHTYVMWRDENKEFKDFIKANSDRYIEMPVSPSAECFSLVFFKFIDFILNRTEYKNGEGTVELHSVRVHETATGYAECFREDEDIIKFSMDEIVFSPGVIADWDKMFTIWNWRK